MSESNDTIRLIAQIASTAIDEEREDRRQTGLPCSRGRTQALLLHLSIIRRLARDALPPTEQAKLPPEEVHTELVKRLAEKIIETADELERRRRIVH
ncbi:hypothetical protein [Bradyrhizobium sp. AS23.2]|uniref:hypothetical protein n=1 Tax=Bradyrhizobium sp. AS23.2 TaxID=1680155 RepID=UPI0011611B00|nr:hypothetical protein [Bradyrhizobium sp. AS23.2]